MSGSRIGITNCWKVNLIQLLKKLSPTFNFVLKCLPTDSRAASCILLLKESYSSAGSNQAAEHCELVRDSPGKSPGTLLCPNHS